MARTGTGHPSTLTGLTQTAARLAPKQLNDEIALAVAQMKGKGVHVGVGAGLAVGALLFVSFLVVALLVAAIAGLAQVMPLWLSALLVAALFLVIAAILGMIGANRIKKAMPLLPNDAIRGLKYDAGVLAEGTSFDPSTLDEPKAKEQKADKDKAKAHKPEPVPYKELLRRTQERREHLARIRDEIEPKVNVRARAAAEREKAVASFSGAAGTARHDAGELVRERWQPLAVMAVSLAALAGFVRQLAKR